MILNDSQIDKFATEDNLFDIYSPKQVRYIDDKKVVSFGLSSFGYDVRLGSKFMAYKSSYSVDQDPDTWSTIIDPLNFDSDTLLQEFEAPDFVILPPHGYYLAHTLEYIKMPKNVSALCIGKSTYARAGVFVNTTPLEPGWEGQITLEIANLTPRPTKLYVNQGICQLLFFQGATPNTTYDARNGKYQGQTGVTVPRG
jgi:dCTP deaminase